MEEECGRLTRPYMWMEKNMKRIGYAIATVVLLLIEVLIAVYVHDAFVRPYIGDVLVVVVIYTLNICTGAMQTVAALRIYVCGTGRGFAAVPCCGGVRLAE